MIKETYLSDGLYASYDGFQIKLRAPRINGNHEVYMEHSFLEDFIKYVNGLERTVPTLTETVRESVSQNLSALGDFTK